MFTKIVIILFFTLASSLAVATEYDMPSPGNDLIGRVLTINAAPGDSLSGIGNKYGIGFLEMLEANPRLQNDLSGGEEVVVPTQFVLPKYREGIVINLAECRLYYFTPDGRHVLTFPVGLGRNGWRTPTTSTTIIRKTTKPVWYVPSSIRAYVLEHTGNLLPDAVQPGPENPLGNYALYLGTHGYLIHGTNQPWSIGQLNSAGCIRLFNSDIEELYHHVHTGTPVKIIHYPYKVGQENGRLFIEAHMPVVLKEHPSDLNMISAERAIRNAVHNSMNINWERVREIVEKQTGIPEPISTESNYASYMDDRDITSDWVSP